MPKFPEIIEHVYHPENAPEDFQSVQIEMSMSEQNLQINLDAGTEMTTSDIENVLQYLERATLKRRRISIYEDCDVFVQQKPVRLSEDLSVLGVG